MSGTEVPSAPPVVESDAGPDVGARPAQRAQRLPGSGAASSAAWPSSVAVAAIAAVVVGSVLFDTDEPDILGAVAGRCWSASCVPGVVTFAVVGVCGPAPSDRRRRRLDRCSRWRLCWGLAALSIGLVVRSRSRAGWGIVAQLLGRVSSPCSSAGWVLGMVVLPQVFPTGWLSGLVLAPAVRRAARRLTRRSWWWSATGRVGDLLPGGTGADRAGRRSRPSSRYAGGPAPDRRWSSSSNGSAAVRTWCASRLLRWPSSGCAAIGHRAGSARRSSARADPVWPSSPAGSGRWSSPWSSRSP